MISEILLILEVLNNYGVGSSTNGPSYISHFCSSPSSSLLLVLLLLLQNAWPQLAAAQQL